MKKKWRTVIACVVVYFLSFGAAAGVMGTDREERELVNAETAVVSTVSSQPDYLVKEHNGMVAVFMSDEVSPVIETDIPVNGLRQTDRELMEQGVVLESYTEVLYLLEDFGS